MKRYYSCSTSFFIFSSKLKALPFFLLNTANSFGGEEYSKTYNSALIDSSQQNQEFKLILLTLFLFVVIVVLMRKNLQLKSKEEQLNMVLNQRELHYTAMIKVEEKERLHLVRNLHDNIGQQLSAAKLNISALQSFSLNVNAADKLMIQKTVDLIDASVKDVRNAAQAIIPNTLIKSGLISALVEKITNSNSSGNTRINLDLVGNINRLSQSEEGILFRILCELINNSLKHAKASEINVQVIKHENELTILIQDNGVGFVFDYVMNLEIGLGLKCVHALITFLKASIFFDSQPGKGSTVSIELPLSFEKKTEKS